MTPELKTRIEEHINTSPVTVFMKGTKQFPMCGFSAAVAQAFTQLGVDFHDVNVMDDEDIRQGIKDYSQWPTIPQIYIKGEFIGGCDILRDMYQSGELQEKIKNLD